MLAPVYMPRRPRSASSAMIGCAGAHADRAEAARQRAERVADLLRLGRADRDRAGGVDKLLLVQRMVAAHQDQGERAVQEVHQGLDLPVGRSLVVLGEILDGAHTGGGKGLGGGKYRVRSENRLSGAGTWPFLCWPRSGSPGSRG